MKITISIRALLWTIMVFDFITVFGSLFVVSPQNLFASESSVLHPLAVKEKTTTKAIPIATQSSSLTKDNGKELSREKIIQKLITASQKGDPSLIPEIEKDLLLNKDLSHAARFFLERCEAPQAALALRSALKKTNNPVLLIGILNSIGMKEDEQSISVVSPFLKNSDSQVRHAASLCLGKIATKESVKELVFNWKNASSSQKNELAFGLTTAGTLLLKKGDLRTAIMVFEEIFKSTDISGYWQAIAFESLVPLLDKSAKSSLIQESAKSKNPIIIRALFSSGRRDKDRSVFNTAVLTHFDSFSKEQIPAIYFLSETNSPEIRAFLLKIVLSSHYDQEQKAIALKGLGRIGDLSTAQTLLTEYNLINSDSKNIINSIVTMTDPAIDSFILDLIGKSSTNPNKEKQTLLFMNLATQRKITSGVDLYLQILKSQQEPTIKNASIKIAAIKALGTTGTSDNLPVLLEQIGRESNINEKVSIENITLEAIRHIILRSKDRETDIDRLANIFKRLSIPNQIKMMDFLSEVRGPRALQLVVSILAGKSATDSTTTNYPTPEIEDNVIRVLAAWKSEDAAPYLLQLAERQQNSKYRIRALRGYARLMKLSTTESTERLKLCKQGFKLAERLDERALFVEAMGRIPTEEALQAVVVYFNNNELRGYAYHASVNIIEKLPGKRSVYAADILQKVYDLTINKDLKTRIEKIKLN